MNENNNDLLDLIAGTVAADRRMSTQGVAKAGTKLTFKRDESGVLWSHDAKTGEKVGRIFEHGDDADLIQEV